MQGGIHQLPRIGVTETNVRIAMVVVDRAMPDMGGDKLAGMIKEKDPDLPIIMLTGFGGVIESTPQAPKNVDTILAKPIAYRELQAAIADLMTGETE